VNHQPPPTREEWGDLKADLDVEFGFQEFGGKTVEEAAPLFAENPIERASELQFAPPVVFNYYIFAIAAAATASSSQGQADLASSFLRLVQTRAVEQPETLAGVWQALLPAVVIVSEQQSFYNADPVIHGSFASLRHEAEAAMRQFQEDGSA
jgi:hypothetical protein